MKMGTFTEMLGASKLGSAEQSPFDWGDHGMALRLTGAPSSEWIPIWPVFWDDWRHATNVVIG